MSFKPKNAGKTGTGGSGNYENRNFPVPKSGARKARVSLIIDLGTQEREDFEDPKTKQTKPQKPCQQLAVFADLVADTVDYGGDIGKQHYRLLLNKTFGGQIEGINFTAVPPRDANGNMIEGKEWGFHPASLLTKLSKAIGKPEVITSLDVEQLLNGAFIADVDINEKDSGKEDKDGNPIIYKNVNFKGASKVPMVETDEQDEDGNPIEVPAPVAELKQPARLITFDSATKEDIKFIRPNILKVIKLATDYAGSNMQKAIEAFEAEQATKGKEETQEEKKQDKPAPKASGKGKKKDPEPEATDMSDMDDDIPF